MTDQIEGHGAEPAGIRVLIVDDHPIVLSGCRSLLAAHPHIEMLEAADGKEGLDAYRRHKPMVAVIDINLPDVSGLELTRQIIAEDAEARILMFSMNDDPVFVAEALRCGAKGYVSKNGDPLAIYYAIMRVASGDRWLPALMAEKLAFMGSTTASPGGPTFSGRETAILRMLASGRSMSEVAAAIGVSYKTTANMCTVIREKLGARTSIEMITLALEQQVIQLPNRK